MEITPVILLEVDAAVSPAMSGERRWLDLCIIRATDGCNKRRVQKELPYEQSRFAAPVFCLQRKQMTMLEETIGAGRLAQSKLIVEPSPRKHSISLAVAALVTPFDNVMLIASSDSLDIDERRLRRGIEAALVMARSGWFVSLCLNGAETEEGFEPFPINLSTKVQEGASLPFPEGAVPLGIELIAAAILLNIVQDHVPEVLTAAEIAVHDARASGPALFLDNEAYRGGASPSIYRVIFGHHDRQMAMII